MKVTKQKLVASKGTTTIQAMSEQEQIVLNGLTINDAILKGLITDLADDAGNFIKSHASDDIEAHYAIVNGKGVRVSNGLSAVLDQVPAMVGDLVFSGGISTKEGAGFDKKWFRLGLPKGLNLGVTEVKLELEPVEA